MPFSTNIMSGCDSGLFICLAQWANSVTEGYFWTLMIIGLGVILFMATYRFGVNRAFGFATLIPGFASIMLLYLGLMPWYVTSMFLIGMILGLVAMRMIES